MILTLAPSAARAENEPIVEPIPAPAPAATGTPLPAAPISQAADVETPHAHHLTESERSTRNAPVEVEPETSQLELGMVLDVLTIIAAIKVASTTSGNQRLWYTGGVLALGALGTGAVVCALGQTSPTRHGGCRASFAGALIGAAGVLPGLLLFKWMASQPCTATGPNADDQCATGGALDGIVGLTIAAGGYVLGTSYGARMGWELGATPRLTAPPPAASVSLLSLQF